MKKAAVVAITFLFLLLGGFYFFAGDENPLEPDSRKYIRPSDEPAGTFLPKKEVKKKGPAKQYNPDNYPNPYNNSLNNPYNNPYKKSYD